MSAPVIARIERLEELTADMKAELWGEGGRPSVSERLYIIETMLRGTSADASKVKIAIIGGLVSVATSLITLLAVLAQAVLARPQEPVKVHPPTATASVTADAGGVAP